MLNCQQVKSILAGTQEELEDLLNEELRKLGKRVEHIDFINPLSEGYAANIIYWSQELASTMTCKLDELPEEPMAEDGAALFVAVMHECQRDLAYKILSEALDKSAPWLFEDKEMEMFIRTVERFAPEDKEEQLE